MTDPSDSTNGGSTMKANCLRCGTAPATTTEPVPLCARCIAEEATDVDLDAVDAYLRGSADEARL